MATDLRKLPRSAGLSYLYRAAEVPLDQIFRLSQSSPFCSMAMDTKYLALRFQRKHYFPDENGLSQPRHVCDGRRPGRRSGRFAMAGRLGKQGTQEAATVSAKNMAEVNPSPHYTIHLGDVYWIHWFSDYLSCPG